MKFGPDDLARYTAVASRANSVVNRVRQVVGAVKEKDDSAVDEAPHGTVKIREDCVTVHYRRGSVSVDIENPPPNFACTDPDACLSNGKLPVRIQGEDQVAGFKGFAADLSYDTSNGAVQSATAIGDELLKPSGLMGPMVYSYGHDRKGRETMTVELAGYKQTAIVNGDGSIAQFEEG